MSQDPPKVYISPSGNHCPIFDWCRRDMETRLAWLERMPTTGSYGAQKEAIYAEFIACHRRKRMEELNIGVMGRFPWPGSIP